MSTKTVGDASEAAILSAFIQRGYAVSIPFGDNDPYDLVVDTGEALLRVQVKTGWLEDGRVRFKTASKTTTGGVPVERDYTASDVDGFAVRCRDTGDLYWVPFEAAGKKHTYLRVTEPKIDHPSVNRAEEYTLDRRFPNTEG